MPFHPQQEQYCGPAALATVLGWSGLPARQEALAAEVSRRVVRARSVTTWSAPRAATAGFCGAVTDLPLLLGELAAGHPVMVLQNLGLDWYRSGTSPSRWATT